MYNIVFFKSINITIINFFIFLYYDQVVNLDKIVKSLA